MLAARSEIMERMRTAFRAEALDLLPELDAALLAMELEPYNSALVNRVFRAMHTVKGSGATAGFTHLAHFAHHVEEAFDLARSGKLAVTSALIDCGLKACDVIREILDMEDEDREAKGERSVTEAVLRLLPGALPVLVGPSPASTALTAWEIDFRPNVNLFRSGTDPLSLLDELRGLGTAKIMAHMDEVPSLDALDPEGCYLHWTVLLVTAESETTMRDVFLFVEDDCDVDLVPLANQPDSIAFLLLPYEEQSRALRRLVEECVTIAEERLECVKTDDDARAMERLATAARCMQRHELAESASMGARILSRVVRIGRGMSVQDSYRVRAVLEGFQLLRKERIA